MKKIMYLFKIISIVSVVSFTSCYAPQTAYYGKPKQKDISGVGVIHIPVVADLEVSQTKITEEVDVSNKTFASELIAARYALRVILNKHKADILIEPTYEFKDKSIIVSGYPAKYKNFRNIEEKDIKLLMVSPPIEKNEEPAIVVPQTSNAQGFKLF